MLVLVETFCNSIYVFTKFLDKSSISNARSLLMSYKFEYHDAINRMCFRQHKNNGND